MAAPDRVTGALMLPRSTAPGLLCERLTQAEGNRTSQRGPQTPRLWYSPHLTIYDEARRESVSERVTPLASLTALP